MPPPDERGKVAWTRFYTTIAIDTKKLQLDVSPGENLVLRDEDTKELSGFVYSDLVKNSLNEQRFLRMGEAAGGSFNEWRVVEGNTERRGQTGRQGQNREPDRRVVKGDAERRWESCQGRYQEKQSGVESDPKGKYDLLRALPRDEGDFERELSKDESQQEMNR
ncbi:hypothetical protein BJ508DRAFT_333490 [Ascobolus immersus RN42]|uniref:Uncharacterized protein n=1 Tax=Ascobolus immersus RN42 TaxID=1160509 RepID=A0A3N4HJE1_ASCIM|nr:hypothetical protein BJ508DRAFT_333490 [Ascobolus immersus RN42]